MDSQDSSLRPSQSLHSPLATPKATIETLQAFGLYTKKRLGQHFLIDDNVIARILNAADLNADDQVLEIGPGIGVLTVALLSRVEKVLALEYDAQLIEVLEYATQEYALQSDGDVSQADGRKLQAGGVSQADRGISQAGNKLTILHEDALNIPQLDLPLHPTKLVANLPYQVAATNVLDCFEYIPSIQQATVMVQKEVAQRMAAKPGTKAYGAYSAKLQLLANPVGSFDVSRNSFLPPPRVDSSVITLVRHDADDVESTESVGGIGDTKRAESAGGSLISGTEHYRELARLIDASFAQRRKTILNNLKAAMAAGLLVFPGGDDDEDRCTGEGVCTGTDRDKNEESHEHRPKYEPDLAEVLLRADIQPAARAETLSPADFVRLHRVFRLTQPEQ